VTGDADKERAVPHAAPSAPSYSASVSMLSSASSGSSACCSAMDEQSDGPQADLPAAPGLASTANFHAHPQFFTPSLHPLAPPPARAPPPPPPPPPGP